MKSHLEFTHYNNAVCLNNFDTFQLEKQQLLYLNKLRVTEFDIYVIQIIKNLTNHNLQLLLDQITFSFNLTMQLALIM